MKFKNRGFTLIELLISLGIMGLVSVAAGECVYQVLRNTERNSNHISAVLALQNADQKISEDVLTAQGVVTENLTLPDFLVVRWIGSVSGNEYQVTYSLVNTSGTTLRELRRNLYVNGSSNMTTTVAQNIDPNPNKTSCNITNGALSLRMTATVGSGGSASSETRNYRIAPRPN
jgi:prepilin-type N-terminal cleavage/methylation domain-containing protein